MFTAPTRWVGVSPRGWGLRGTTPSGPPHTFPPLHKPSFFQDYERRRPLEIEAILKAPLAFAHTAGIDVPTLETITAIAAHRAAKFSLYLP